MFWSKLISSHFFNKSYRVLNVDKHWHVEVFLCVCSIAAKHFFRISQTVSLLNGENVTPKNSNFWSKKLLNKSWRNKQNLKLLKTKFIYLMPLIKEIFKILWELGGVLLAYSITAFIKFLRITKLINFDCFFKFCLKNFLIQRL